MSSLRQQVEASERLVAVLCKGLGVDGKPILAAVARAPKRERLAALEALYRALTQKAREVGV